MLLNRLLTSLCRNPPTVRLCRVSAFLCLQADRHALRVCDRSAVVRGTSYIAAYVASTMQSVVMIFEVRWNIGEREPSVTHIGNKLGIPGPSALRSALTRR